MELAKEVLKAIQITTDRKLTRYRADRTYKSVVTKVDKHGYVVLDEAGNERTVACCLPGIVLKAGQVVWLKEPLGDLRQLHICGILS